MHNKNLLLLKTTKNELHQLQYNNDINKQGIKISFLGFKRAVKM